MKRLLLAAPIVPLLTAAPTWREWWRRPPWWPRWRWRPFPAFPAFAGAAVAALAIAAAAAALPSPTAVVAPCSQACMQRVKHRAWIDARRVVVRPHQAWLTRVAQCESSGDWHINTGNGFFGGVQFTRSSWAIVGGRGYPQDASILEQMFRAVKLLQIQGIGAWPVCGRR